MDLLTARQLARLRELGDDHNVVGERDGSPILERADGQLLLLQPDGRLAVAGPISGVESYLRVGPG